MRMGIKMRMRMRMMVMMVMMMMVVVVMVVLMMMMMVMMVMMVVMMTARMTMLIMMMIMMKMMMIMMTMIMVMMMLIIIMMLITMTTWTVVVVVEHDTQLPQGTSTRLKPNQLLNAILKHSRLPVSIYRSVFRMLQGCVEGPVRVYDSSSSCQGCLGSGFSGLGFRNRGLLLAELFGV